MSASKRQRVINDIEHVDPMSSNNMNVIDMNIDCIEEIFEYLSIIDLLRVADTNKRFQKAASLVFSRKYAFEYVSIKSDRIKLGWRNIDEIRDFIDSFRLLRCFGQLISNIHIQLDDAVNSVHGQFAELFRYVNEYCAQNLKELRIVDVSRTVIIDNISKAFAKLESISFDGPRLGENLTNLNELLPQMRQLILKNNIILNPKCIEAHFPHLEKFEYLKEHDQLVNQFENENFEKFIRSNGQLKHLLLSDFDVELIRTMAENLHQLESLKLISPYSTDDLQHFEQCHFKSVNIFVVVHVSQSFPINSLKFDNLVNFTAGGFKFADLRDFISKHLTITSLGIQNRKREPNLNAATVLEGVKLLPSLSHLFLMIPDHFTVNDVVSFTAELKLMKRFYFPRNGSFDMQNLEQRLRNEWHVAQDLGPYIYLRRNDDI